MAFEDVLQGFIVGYQNHLDKVEADQKAKHDQIMPWIDVGLKSYQIQANQWANEISVANQNRQKLEQDITLLGTGPENQESVARMQRERDNLNDYLTDLQMRPPDDPIPELKNQWQEYQNNGMQGEFMPTFKQREPYTLSRYQQNRVIMNAGSPNIRTQGTSITSAVDSSGAPPTANAPQNTTDPVTRTHQLSLSQVRTNLVSNYASRYNLPAMHSDAINTAKGLLENLSNAIVVFNREPIGSPASDRARELIETNRHALGIDGGPQGDAIFATLSDGLISEKLSELFSSSEFAPYAANVRQRQVEISPTELSSVGPEDEAKLRALGILNIGESSTGFATATVDLGKLIEARRTGKIGGQFDMVIMRSMAADIKDYENEQAQQTIADKMRNQNATILSDRNNARMNEGGWELTAVGTNNSISLARNLFPNTENTPQWENSVKVARVMLMNEATANYQGATLQTRREARDKLMATYGIGSEVFWQLYNAETDPQRKSVLAQMWNINMEPPSSIFTRGQMYDYQPEEVTPETWNQITANSSWLQRVNTNTNAMNMYFRAHNILEKGVMNGTGSYVPASEEEIKKAQETIDSFNRNPNLRNLLSYYSYDQNSNSALLRDEYRTNAAAGEVIVDRGSADFQKIFGFSQDMNRAYASTRGNGMFDTPEAAQGRPSALRAQQGSLATAANVDAMTAVTGDANRTAAETLSALKDTIVPQYAGRMNVGTIEQFTRQIDSVLAPKPGFGRAFQEQARQILDATIRQMPDSPERVEMLRALWTYIAVPESNASQNNQTAGSSNQSRQTAPTSTPTATPATNAPRNNMSTSMIAMVYSNQNARANGEELPYPEIENQPAAPAAPAENAQESNQPQQPNAAERIANNILPDFLHPEVRGIGNRLGMAAEGLGNAAAGALQAITPEQPARERNLHRVVREGLEAWTGMLGTPQSNQPASQPASNNPIPNAAPVASGGGMKPEDMAAMQMAYPPIYLPALAGMQMMGEGAQTQQAGAQAAPQAGATRQPIAQPSPAQESAPNRARRLPEISFAEASELANRLPSAAQMEELDNYVKNNGSLRRGSSGPEVETLQKWMVAMGYMKMPSGVRYGTFGRLTEDAVKGMQELLGVDVGSNAGFVGPRTLIAMGRTNSGFENNPPRGRRSMEHAGSPVAQNRPVQNQPVVNNSTDITSIPGVDAQRLQQTTSQYVGRGYYSQYDGSAAGRRFDCSNFVATVMNDLGHPLMDGNSPATVTDPQYRATQPVNGNPRIGDLVFFAKPLDRNGRKQLDRSGNYWWHVAIYDGVDEQGNPMIYDSGPRAGVSRRQLSVPANAGGYAKIEYRRVP